MTGRVRVQWRGPEAKAAARGGAVRGLQLASEHLLGEAQKETPFREGHLERSARPHLYPERLMAAVSFNTVYARRQHEETTWHHPIKGKAKYLEDPFRRERQVMLRLIETSVRRAHSNGGGGGR